MRITSGIIQQQLLKHVRSGLARMEEAQRRVTTGLRFERASEDPGAAADVMRINQTLRAIDQQRRNGAAVRTRLDTQEAVLSQVTDLLTRAKELAVSEANGTATGQTRAAAAAEVSALFDQVVSLGNTRIGDEFVFGGNATAAPPFLADGTYVGDAGVRQVEIGDGQLVAAGDSGQTLLVASGVLTALAAVRDQLALNDQAGIQASIGTLDTAFGEVQTLLAGTGSRVRQLDVASQNADALESTLNLRRADRQEVNVEEAALDLYAAQTALEASYLAVSRVLDTTLTNYLR